MNAFAANLRKLRLDKHLTQEQSAEALGVSAQSVSRWETGATCPDVLLLPHIAKLYGVLVDDLFRPSPKGYDNNAQRLLAVYEHSHKPEDFMAAAAEYEKLLRTNAVSADDWRSCGVLHEYMMNHCIEKALACYGKAMTLSQDADPEMYYRTQRQKLQLRCRIGQGEACILEQEACVHAHPDNPEEWSTLAAAHYMTAQYEDALTICMTALEKFPEEGLLHVYAGDSCRQLKRYDAAFTHWQKAICLDGKYLDALFSTAFCYGELGQFDKAADVWEDIVRRLDERGLEIEAQWPRTMAEKCRCRENCT